jgi:hypothetical protein
MPPSLTEPAYQECGILKPRHQASLPQQRRHSVTGHKETMLKIDIFPEWLQKMVTVTKRRPAG